MNAGAVLTITGVVGAILFAARAAFADDGAARVPPEVAAEAPSRVYGRVLIVELSGSGTDAEKAGMVSVAENRRRGWGSTAAAVVFSQDKSKPEFGSGCRADSACSYNRGLAGAHTHPRFDDAVAFAGRVLAGTVPNPIGPRRTFCHPMHPTFAKVRADGTADERARATELRQEAALADGAEATRLYREAMRVERVHAKYAWDPETGRHLPRWTVAKEHGGEAAHQPITIGSTRFA